MTIEPVTEHEWEAVRARSPYTGPFHDYRWGSLVTQCLGGQYHPFIAKDAGRTWLIPAYTGSPWVDTKTTFRVGSIGYGGPVTLHTFSDPEQELHHARAVLKKLASVLGANRTEATLYPTIDWHMTDYFKVDVDDIVPGQTCRIKLLPNIDDVSSSTLSSNVRHAVRKAHKLGVVVRAIDAANAKELDNAYDLLSRTQHAVGAAYVTPRVLFNELCDLSLNGTEGRAFVAYLEDRLIGVMVLVYDTNEAFFLLHGWDRAYAHTCANQALLWAMIEFAVARHIPYFNLGASHSQTLLESKLRWGAHLETVPTLKLRF